jgi:diketogulonate reductase-like aldo/keto reductase
MEKQVLRANERPALGFGCTQLTSLPDRRSAVRLLEHAFSEGVTHFDVARAYGFGRAEGILAEFLKGKRDRVTVATKFGLHPPQGLAGNRFVIDGLKRVLRPFPKLLGRAKNRGASMGKSGRFGPEAATASLEKSLRELGTDYIDIFLLHEADVADALHPALIETLEGHIAAGKIRDLGIASRFGRIADGAPVLPALYRVVQFDDNAVERNLSRLVAGGDSQQRGKGRKAGHSEALNSEVCFGNERLLIRHSVFTPLARLTDSVSERPEVSKRFSEAMELDLTDSRVLGSLLLDYALAGGPGFVLFSSTQPSRITENVRSAATVSYAQRQRELFAEFADDLLAPASAMAPSAIEKTNDRALSAQGSRSSSSTEKQPLKIESAS